MSYNLKQLFVSGSLLFDCLTICNLFILSVMEGPILFPLYMVEIKALRNQVHWPTDSKNTEIEYKG